MGQNRFSLLAATVGMAVMTVAAKDCQPLVTDTLPDQYPDKDYIPLCIAPDETAETTLDWDNDLYPDGLKMVYAYQTYSNEQILDFATNETIFGTPDNLQNAAIWFEYDKDNFKSSNERATDWDLSFIDDVSGATGGGNGGCDGLFGDSCTKQILSKLKDTLWESTYPVGRRPTQQVDIDYAWRAIGDLEINNCPDPVQKALFSTIRHLALETEAKDDDSYIFPSGNATFAYRTETHENTADEEKKTAFAIIAQYPYISELKGFGTAPKTKWFTKDDIEVTIACLKHDKSDNSDKSGSDSKSSDDSSSDSSGGSSDAGEDDAALTNARVGLFSLLVGIGATIAFNSL